MLKNQFKHCLRFYLVIQTQWKYLWNTAFWCRQSQRTLTTPLYKLKFEMWMCVSMYLLTIFRSVVHCLKLWIGQILFCGHFNSSVFRLWMFFHIVNWLWNVFLSFHHFMDCRCELYKLKKKHAKLKVWRNESSVSSWRTHKYAHTHTQPTKSGEICWLMP